MTLCDNSGIKMKISSLKSYIRILHYPAILIGSFSFGRLLAQNFDIKVVDLTLDPETRAKLAKVRARQKELFPTEGNKASLKNSKTNNSKIDQRSISSMRSR